MDALVHNIAAAAGEWTTAPAMTTMVDDMSNRIPNSDCTHWTHERRTPYGHRSNVTKRQGGSTVAVHERHGSPIPNERVPRRLLEQQPDKESGTQELILWPA